MQEAGRGLGRESRLGNRELEGAGSDVGKGKLPVAVGQNLLARGLIAAGAGKPYLGTGDDRPALIRNGSGDATGQWGN